MRRTKVSDRVLVVAVFVLSGCAAGLAQPEPTPVWRMHTEHLAEDRALARACLERDDRDCSDVIQPGARSRAWEDVQYPEQYRHLVQQD